VKHAGVVGILGLSGCATLADDSPPSGRRITDLSVTGLDSAPISATATATHPLITSEQTAQFDMTVTVQQNDIDSLGFPNSIPFHAPKSSSPPGVLLIQGNQSNRIERDSQETWIPANTLVVADSGTSVYLESDSNTLTESWAVWGDPDHVSFIEPGTYEFGSEITVHPPGESFRWTLSLTIATESPGE